MAHLLRYGAAVHGSITRSNSQHMFSHTYALLIYDSNAIYSMIPKNGCTTMRLSIALANGAIADRSEWEWIHLNNDSFNPSFKELALASYRFTVLRCPYGRLVSCYLDKIVKRTPDADKFISVSKFDGDIDNLTFRRFCDGMTKPSVRAANIHWRPQQDFLVYAHYDNYFCFEDFPAIAPALKSSIGLNLVDARPVARHDSSQYKTISTSLSFADVELPHLEALLHNGYYPSPGQFYERELIETIYSAYQADFELYERECPGKGLFTAQPVACLAAVAI